MSYVKKLAGIIREVKKETGEEDVFKLVNELISFYFIFIYFLFYLVYLLLYLAQ